MTFVTSKFGKPKAVYGGYSYTVNYMPKKGNYAYYTCDKKGPLALNCPGRAKIDYVNSVFIEIRTDHNHEPEPTLNEAVTVSFTFYSLIDPDSKWIDSI